MNVSDTVIMEGWLVRSREQGMRFPPFKSKWVRRYFVLRICDRNIGNFVLDEFRKDDKRRLRKSVDLTRLGKLSVNFFVYYDLRTEKHAYYYHISKDNNVINQIDSYLQLADSSCSTTMRFGGFQWIFSLYFMKGNSEKKIQTYFVAESEDKMRDWVLNLCRACKLEKQNEEENSNQAVRDEGYLHRCELPVSSFAALSMSSGRSSESVFDTPRSDITSDDVRDSFAGASARSAHSLEEEGDILFDFCFSTNVRRKSRFTRRVLGLAESRPRPCRYEMVFHSQRTSKSNPVTPSEGKQYCDGFVSNGCGGSNPTLPERPSLENIWYNVPDRNPLSSLWTVSRSSTSRTVGYL
uniref:PH domain-containing protein n=1 Tax=Heterorhabditis bacteriophora TaxID=37862 RepID=A0A1I7X0V1_HETBA